MSWNKRVIIFCCFNIYFFNEQGSLAELGRLLLQGGFSMWAEGKRDRLRELRLKPMQRHVFLYERGVVLCKRVGKEMDKATYQFKHLLKVK